MTYSGINLLIANVQAGGCDLLLLPTRQQGLHSPTHVTEWNLYHQQRSKSLARAVSSTLLTTAPPSAFCSG
jgi:hypothetical protein